MRTRRINLEAMPKSAQNNGQKMVKTYTQSSNIYRLL